MALGTGPKFCPKLDQELKSLFCLFVLRLNVPVNNFSVMLGWSHPSWVLPVLSGSKVSCSKTQHGKGRFRTPKLSLWSQEKSLLIHSIFKATLSV